MVKNCPQINSFSRSPSEWRLLRAGVAGLGLAGLPLVMFSGAQARPGERLASAAAGAAGVLSFPALAAASSLGFGVVMGMGTRFLSPKLRLLARPGAAAAGIFLAGAASAALAARVFRSVRWMSDEERQLRRLEMGSGYQDSLLARALRLRAVEEMNSSLPAARAYLGREALLLHR